MQNGNRESQPPDRDRVGRQRNVSPTIEQSSGTTHKTADLQQIKRAIDILFEPGQVVELRVLCEYGVYSGFFDDLGVLAANVKSLSDTGRYAGLYYTLNPCHDALLARRPKNVVVAKTRDLTTDSDVMRRRWFLVDCDPKRPKGVSATHGEKQAAKDVINDVAAWLADEEWPAPVKALSGNGYHLLYRVDEANDRATAELFKRVLQAIAERFSTDAVSIDTNVFNASRIVKAYGSLAAKGVSTPERPHRLSKIFNPPQPIGVVTRAQLESLAANSANPKQPVTQRGSGKLGPDKKIDEFLESGGIAVEARTKKEDGTLMWKFACVFNSEHKDAALFLLPNGAFAYNCFHDSCAENQWPQFRAWVEAKAGAKFRFARNELPYEATENGLVWRKSTRDGVEDVLLTNFTAHITADIVEDDGAERRRRFEIESTLHDRTDRVEVAASQFGAMNWVPESLGALAVIFPPGTNRDHARAAIQLLSKEVEHKTIYTHLGWRLLGEQWAYLHTGGAITATGLKTDVSVSLLGALANFDLPSPPSGAELKAALSASLRMLDVAPDSVSVPVFAGIWRAPLGPCDFTLHIVGPTGGGKTEFATLAQQHFGKAFTSRNLAAAWSGTANSLEAIAFAAKDALLVIDDFAPQGSLYEVSRANRDADRFIRAQGNNAGRSRLRADATLRHTKSPRGLALSTGEDTPRGHSTRARMSVSELGPNDMNWERLTQSQHDARNGMYEKAFAAYVQWVAARHDRLLASLPSTFAELRAAASRSAAHKRTPEVVAHLAVGVQTFLRFAQSCQALSKPDAEALWRRCWLALGAIAREQSEQQRSEEPASRFMALLNASLSSGAAQLACCKDGWTRNDARGVLIGWLNGDSIFLEPETAFAAVQRFARDQGDAITIGAKTLWKRMNGQGLLARHDKDRNLFTASIDGVHRRVVAINASNMHVDAALRGHAQKHLHPEDAADDM
jgi:Domain of unknown function (DUF927)